jgi:hypothetical protein
MIHNDLENFCVCYLKHLLKHLEREVLGIGGPFHFRKKHPLMLINYIKISESKGIIIFKDPIRTPLNPRTATCK